MTLIPYVKVVRGQNRFYYIISVDTSIYFVCDDGDYYTYGYDLYGFDDSNPDDVKWKYYGYIKNTGRHADFNLIINTNFKKTKFTYRVKDNGEFTHNNDWCSDKMFILYHKLKGIANRNLNLNIILGL